MNANDATLHDNEIVVEAWNTVLFDKFVRFKHLLVAGLSGHSNECLSRAAYRPGERVLDVGCGFGDCTTAIARLVRPGGEAAGVDCAENFVRASERDAAAAGVTNARFFAADVQDDDLEEDERQELLVAPEPPPVDRDAVVERAGPEQHVHRKPSDGRVRRARERQPEPGEAKGGGQRQERPLEREVLRDPLAEHG